MKRGAHWVSWMCRGHGDSDKVNSCHTTATLETYSDYSARGGVEKVNVHVLDLTDRHSNGSS